MDVTDLEPKIEQAAELLDMMAHPQRLRILCTLHGGEWSVVRLAEQIGMSQPNLSHHLKKLRDSGLVSTRRDAQTIFYALHGEGVKAVLGVLHGLYCASPAEQGGFKAAC
ncbi:MAG: metalloregulator ArsR/SmtB family transcription factor [Rhizobiaceae bacterium]|nr:metalloregulator ArsR/SmtB family transcription factor [Rhizobiaceae bacterium]